MKETNDDKDTTKNGTEAVVRKINLSNTPLNPGFRKEGLFDLPPNLKRRMRRQFEFRNIPTDEQLWDKVQKIVNIVNDYNKHHEECRDVVLGTASLLIAPLEFKLIQAGYRVHYFAAQKKWNDGRSNAEYIHYGTRPALVVK